MRLALSRCRVSSPGESRRRSTGMASVFLENKAIFTRVKVNGEMIKRRPLVNGDQVQVGSTRFRYERPVPDGDRHPVTTHRAGGAARGDGGSSMRARRWRTSTSAGPTVPRISSGGSANTRYVSWAPVFSGRHWVACPGATKRTRGRACPGVGAHRRDPRAVAACRSSAVRGVSPAWLQGRSDGRTAAAMPSQGPRSDRPEWPGGAATVRRSGARARPAPGRGHCRRRPERPGRRGASSSSMAPRSA